MTSSVALSNATTNTIMETSMVMVLQEQKDTARTFPTKIQNNLRYSDQINQEQITTKKSKNDLTRHV